MKDKLAIDGVSYDEVSLGYLALYANLRLIILLSACRSMSMRYTSRKPYATLTLHQRVRIGGGVSARHGGRMRDGVQRICSS